MRQNRTNHKVERLYSISTLLFFTFFPLEDVYERTMGEQRACTAKPVGIFAADSSARCSVPPPSPAVIGNRHRSPV